jgi:hypothetical protein
MAEKWVVETFYNTDPDGKWVDYDDWSNVTLHGPFDTPEQAEHFLQDFQADDKDVKDMEARPVTDADTVINPAMMVHSSGGDPHPYDAECISTGCYPA